MNLFKASLKWQGFPLDRSIELLSEIQHYDREKFFEYQQKKIWEQLQYHNDNTPWYRALLNEVQLDNWENLPIITKSDFQKPLQALLSNNVDLKNVYLNNTSGSTGKPFHFAKDKYCHAATWAYIFQCYASLGLEYGKSMQARFFGIPLSRKIYWKERIKDTLSARVRFPVFDLSDNQIEKYLRSFYKTKFEYIYGYTSSLVLVAKFLQSRNLILKDICSTLKWCIVTSEVCSPEDRVILEQAFGVPVINEYGAAELDIIAFQDRDGDWLLNEENLYIEILSDEGKAVPAGEEGSVIVTSLHNKAMPFIRYNLGDIVSVFPERKGFHRKIKSMQGRTNDVAILPSGKKSPGLTFYYVSKSLLEKGGFLKEFTIKQTALDSFHFEYVAENELSSDQRRKVQEMMDLYLEPGLKATFEKVPMIHRTAAGKFKHFQSLIHKSQNTLTVSHLNATR